MSLEKTSSSAPVDAVVRQSCEKWSEHVWVEEYYGHKCNRCDLFFAHCCAPWDDDGLPQDGTSYHHFFHRL